MASVQKSSRKSSRRSSRRSSGRSLKVSKQMNMSEMVVVGLLLVAILLGYYYVYSRNQEQEGFQSVNLTPDDNEVIIVLFYTDWCGYCKKFKPEWEKASAEMNNSTINNNKVRFEKVDCDANESLAKEYQVNGYPTVKVLRNGQEAEDFEGERSLSGIRSYLESL
jgi:protein disulfide-isomerase-like protein